MLLLVAFSRWPFNYRPTFDTQSALHALLFEVREVGSSLFQAALKTVIELKKKVCDSEILTAVLMKNPVFCFMMSCIYRVADKSLARPGRKQITATKLQLWQATQK